MGFWGDVWDSTKSIASGAYNVATGDYMDAYEDYKDVSRPWRDKPSAAASASPQLTPPQQQWYDYVKAGGTLNIPGGPRITGPQPAPQPKPTPDPYAGTRFGHSAAGGGDLARSPQGLDQLSPGVGEQTLNNQQHRFWQPTNSEEWLKAQQPGMSGPGDSQQYWGKIAGDLKGPGASASAWGFGNEVARGPSRMEGNVGAYQDQLGQPSRSGRVADSAAGFGRSPTASEAAMLEVQRQIAAAPPRAQLQVFNDFESQPMGAGAFYDRQAQKATQEVQRALAAQGLAGSAFGGNAVAGAIADIRAKQALDEANYRLEEARVRGQLATGADTGVLDTARTMGDVAAAADRARVDRMVTEGNLAATADDYGLRSTLARFGMDKDVDARKLDLMAQLGVLGNYVDANDTARIGTFGEVARGADAAGVDRFRAGTDAALGADAASLNQTIAGMNAANEAQRLHGDRAQQAFDNEFALGEASAQTQMVYDQLNLMQQLGLIDSAMASELGAYASALEESQRRAEQNYRFTEMVLDAAGTFSGKKAKAS